MLDCLKIVKLLKRWTSGCYCYYQSIVFDIQQPSVSSNCKDRPPRVSYEKLHITIDGSRVICGCLFSGYQANPNPFFNNLKAFSNHFLYMKAPHRTSFLIFHISIKVNFWYKHVARAALFAFITK
jgi:hypothetical protein